LFRRASLSGVKQQWTQYRTTLYDYTPFGLLFIASKTRNGKAVKPAMEGYILSILMYNLTLTLIAAAI
jgi:hypothetical protein